MKYAIVNESISDAVLYLGSYKRIMQYPLLAGFCKLLSDGISEQADAFECDLDRLSKRASPGFVNDFSRGNEIVVITHSLGTRMLFDALGLMSDPEFVEKTKTDLRDLGVVVSENEGGIEKVREIFQRSLSKVFTFANQIPLLELGNVRNPVVGLATRGQYPELGKGFSKFLEQRAGLADGPLQLNARWQCRWKWSGPNGVARLESVELVQ